VCVAGGRQGRWGRGRGKDDHFLQQLENKTNRKHGAELPESPTRSARTKTSRTIREENPVERDR